MPTFQEHIQYILKHSLARTNRFQVIIPLPTALNKITNNVSQDKISSLYGNDVIKRVNSYSGSGATEVTRGLEIMVNQTEIPGKTLTTSEVKYNGEMYRLPYSAIYETHQFLFKCSSDLYEKNIIDTWMNSIFNPFTYTIGYLDDYSVNITINQLNERDEIVYSSVLVDAFPIMCAPISVSNDDRDTYAQLQTSWSYKKWFRVEENINIGSTSSTLDPVPEGNSPRIIPSKYQAPVLQQTTNNYGVNSLSQTPFGPLVAPLLSNPAVQEALDILEDTTGLDLDGEAANIYNQIDLVVKNTTGGSINRTATLIEGMKAQIGLSGSISDTQTASLIGRIDEVLSKLRG